MGPALKFKTKVLSLGRCFITAIEGWGKQGKMDKKRLTWAIRYDSLLSFACHQLWRG